MSDTTSTVAGGPCPVFKRPTGKKIGTVDTPTSDLQAVTLTDVMAELKVIRKALEHRGVRYEITRPERDHRHSGGPKWFRQCQ